MKDALLIIVFVLFLGVSVIAAHEHEALADREDAAAMNSREWAGRQACGPNSTPEWLDAKTLRCLRNLDDPKLVAGGRP